MARFASSVIALVFLVLAYDVAAAPTYQLNARSPPGPAGLGGPKKAPGKLAAGNCIAETNRLNREVQATNRDIIKLNAKDATLLSQLILAQNGLTDALSGLGQIQTASRAGAVPSVDAFTLLSNGLVVSRDALNIQSASAGVARLIKDAQRKMDRAVNAGASVLRICGGDVVDTTTIASETATATESIVIDTASQTATATESIVTDTASATATDSNVTVTASQTATVTDSVITDTTTETATATESAITDTASDSASETLSVTDTAIATETPATETLTESVSPTETESPSATITTDSAIITAAPTDVLTLVTDSAAPTSTVDGNAEASQTITDVATESSAASGTCPPPQTVTVTAAPSVQTESVDPPAESDAATPTLVSPPPVETADKKGADKGNKKGLKDNGKGRANRLGDILRGGLRGVSPARGNGRGRNAANRGRKDQKKDHPIPTVVVVVSSTETDSITIASETISTIAAEPTPSQGDAGDIGGGIDDLPTGPAGQVPNDLPN